MILVNLLGLFFISNIQPLFMISIMIMIVLSYSYMLYIILSGYWYSYMLVLVMLSGVLVVFTYMASMSPNDSFENYNLLLLWFLLMIILSVFYKYLYGNNMMYMGLNMWLSYMGMYNLFLVSFLFGMMLMVVWISNMGEGAMRLLYKGAWVKG